MKLVSTIIVISLSAYYAIITVNRYLAYPARVAAIYEAEMVRDAAHAFVRKQCVDSGSNEWSILTSAAELATAGYLDTAQFGGGSSAVTGITWQLLEASNNFIMIRALNVPDAATLNILSRKYPSIRVMPAVSGMSIADIAMPVNYKTGQSGIVDHRVFMKSEYDFDCTV